MTKPVLCILLALCLAAPGVALARAALNTASPGGTVVSASAGRRLVSSVGRSMETATLRSDCGGSHASAECGPTGEASEPQSSAVGLRPNCPNPFNPATAVSYYVNGPTHVLLTVHDVSGRLVATLADGSDEGGCVRRILWQGTNEGGDPLPSGVYLLRIVTESFAETRKMVLLK